MGKREGKNTDIENPDIEEKFYELAESSQKMPSNLYGNNSLLMNHIIKLLPDEDYGKRQVIHPLKKRDGTANNKISTYYTLSFTKEMKYSDRINEYDKAIADCLYTLKKNGKDKFTIEEVARVFYGNPNHRLTKKQREYIKNSVMKMSFTKLEIQCSDELKARTKGKMTDFSGTDVFLYAKLIKMTVNGYSAEGFVMEGIPLIYSYAEAIGQITSSPIELLSSTRNNTSEFSLLQKIIIKRIELLKNSHNNMNISKIRYGGEKEGDGIFGEIGCCHKNYKNLHSWRNKKNKLRKCVRDTLDNCILNQYISSYEEYFGSDNKTVLGVNILL